MSRRSDRIRGWLALAMAAFLLSSCRSADRSSDRPSDRSTRGQSAQSSAAENSGSFVFSSTDFPANGVIPKKFTCAGENVSPALQWSGEPGGTHSYALIVEDPDAPSGAWIHWVVFDIPHHVSSLPQAVPPEPQSTVGFVQGDNDFHKLGYGGPCPPPGSPHHYVFRLYALTQKLGLKPGATKDELADAMEDNILSQVTLTGTFGR